jgi:hypothetical protein
MNSKTIEYKIAAVPGVPSGSQTSVANAQMASESVGYVVVTSDARSGGTSDGKPPRWFNYVEGRLAEFENRREDPSDPLAYPKPSSDLVLAA